MGYRSEVGIKCQKKAFELFKEAYTNADCNPDKILSDGDEYIMIWDWVKWYDEYPDIKAICDVMSKLDEYSGHESDKKGLGYSMIRLGESDEDIEQRSNSCLVEFYYVRELDTDGFEPL